MKVAAWILLMLGLVVASLAASKIDDALGVPALLLDPTFLFGMGTDFAKLKYPFNKCFL